MKEEFETKYILKNHNCHIIINYVKNSPYIHLIIGQKSINIPIKQFDELLNMLELLKSRIVEFLVDEGKI